MKGRVNRWPEIHELAMDNDPLVHFPGVAHDDADADIAGHEQNPFYVRVVISTSTSARRLDSERTTRAAGIRSRTPMGRKAGTCRREYVGPGKLLS